MFTWDIDPVFITWPVTIRYYGLILGSVLLIGFFLWRWQMRRGGHGDELIGQFVTYGVIGVLAGSRLGHCLFYDMERCFNPPINVIKVWQGGLSSHGATVGLALALILFARRKKLSVVEVCDRFSMCAAMGAILVRVANFINSEIVGRPTDGSWGVRFPRYDQGPIDQIPYRHPSQLYEVALGIVVFFVLFFVDRRYKEKRPLGLLSALFLITYFTGRFFVEFFKAYQTLNPRVPLTMGQWLSVPAVTIGGIWLYRTLKDPRPTAEVAASRGAGQERKTRGRSKSQKTSKRSKKSKRSKDSAKSKAKKKKKKAK